MKRNVVNDESVGLGLVESKSRNQQKLKASSGGLSGLGIMIILGVFILCLIAAGRGSSSSPTNVEYDRVGDMTSRPTSKYGRMTPVPRNDETEAPSTMLGNRSYTRGDSKTASVSDYSSSDRWWEGATLYTANVSEWKEASRQNKLATAGDWLASSTWSGKLNSYEDFRRLKQKAYKLVDGIDYAVSDVTKSDLGDVLKVKELAAIVIASSNDLGPN